MVHGTEIFVRDTEMFEKSSVRETESFLPKRVQNGQGTEGFVRDIEKFEISSIRVIESVLYF